MKETFEIYKYFNISTFPPVGVEVHAVYIDNECLGTKINGDSNVSPFFSFQLLRIFIHEVSCGYSAWLLRFVSRTESLCGFTRNMQAIPNIPDGQL